jgi:DNA replication protein DnaC
MNKVNANIPPQFRDFTLTKIDQPESQKVVKKIQKYIEKLSTYRKKGIGLYLYGNTGTAKSALGCIILMNALKRRYTCYFTDVEEYLDLSVNKKDDEEAQEVVRRLSNADFLVIDDLGREYRDVKGFVESQVDELIRYRIKNLLPTIITTNKTREELAVNKFRLLSVLNEHFLIIPFTTKDYRKKIGANLQNGQEEI